MLLYSQCSNKQILLLNKTGVARYHVPIGNFSVDLDIAANLKLATITKIKNVQQCGLTGATSSHNSDQVTGLGNAGNLKKKKERRLKERQQQLRMLKIKICTVIQNFFHRFFSFAWIFLTLYYSFDFSFELRFSFY